MTHKHWTIAPLVLATAVRDRSQILLMGEIGEPIEGAVLGWLLMSGQEKVLVDTGLGPVSKANARFNQTAEQTMEEQLRRFNTSLGEITIVINTHLHTDHCGYNASFKSARFFVQKKEMEYAQNPLPIHKPAYGIDLTGLEFELLKGDTEIVPGIRVILTPGHSPGSQSIVVDTIQGPYIIAGDTITHFANMDVPKGVSFWPGAVYVDLNEYYHSLDRLKSMGGYILPGHDMLVLKKEMYP